LLLHPASGDGWLAFDPGDPAGAVVGQRVLAEVDEQPRRREQVGVVDDAGTLI
jgi:hypothetical protein